MLLQCVHRINPLNTGDIWSAPLRYVPTGRGIEVRFFDIYEDAAKIDPQHPVIIGGGGLFREPSGCRELVHQIVTQARSQVIIWGAGLNTELLFNRDRFPGWVGDATLCGVRDYQFSFPRWVPCVSCLNSVFDRVYPIEHDVVLYYGVPLPIHGLPTKCCQEGATLEEAIRFLASGETVVTNSYHGAYWATLLGRKVVLIPNQDYSKFAFLKHQHVCASAFNWKELVPHARRYDALRECREANLRFAKDVGRTLRSHLPLSNEIQRLPKPCHPVSLVSAPLHCTA